MSLFPPGNCPMPESQALWQQESFTVRIWREEGQPGWRGWVQHTRSGESAALHSVQELVAFFEQRTGRLDDTPHNGLK